MLAVASGSILTSRCDPTMVVRGDGAVVQDWGCGGRYGGTVLGCGGTMARYSTVVQHGGTGHRHDNRK